MERKSQKRLFKSLMGMLWGIGGMSTIQANPQVDNLYEYPGAPKFEFTKENFNDYPDVEASAANPYLEVNLSSNIPYSPANSVVISSSIRGAIGMSHAKFCGTLSSFGPFLNAQLMNRPGALENLAQLNDNIDFVPVTNMQLFNEIWSNPQIFVNSRAGMYGGTVYCLDITNGGMFSSSSYPNFFQKLYVSGHQPIDAGRFSTSDRSVIGQIHELLAERSPISIGEVMGVMGGYPLPNPSGFVCFLIDRAAQTIYLATFNYVPGKFENVFTPERFGTWIQEASSGISQVKNIIETGREVVTQLSPYFSKTLERVSNSDNLLAFRGANMASNAASAFGLNRFIGDRIPEMFRLQDLSGEKRPMKILEKISRSLEPSNIARLRDSIRIYDTGTLLPKNFVQDFIENPKKATTQLASRMKQNVCCLIVTSGRIMLQDFFRTLYYLRRDTSANSFVPEIVNAIGLSDQRVISALGTKHVVEELASGRVIFLVFDTTSEQIYWVRNSVQQKFQIPNIFQ
ncbi:MAG: hypothetical protein LW808_000375 [Verrucomicrobiota bacterium]|nr:MAG: hypothetical protein LW808_000375 [Verrucomicrobiota bacterium]